MLTVWKVDMNSTWMLPCQGGNCSPGEIANGPDSRNGYRTMGYILLHIAWLCPSVNSGVLAGHPVSLFSWYSFIYVYGSFVNLINLSLKKKGTLLSLPFTTAGLWLYMRAQRFSTLFAVRFFLFAVRFFFFAVRYFCLQCDVCLQLFLFIWSRVPSEPPYSWIWINRLRPTITYSHEDPLVLDSKSFFGRLV
jgi:hypothetical protein